MTMTAHVLHTLAFWLLQQTIGDSPIADRDTLQLLFKAAIFTGSGWLVKRTVDWLIMEWEDGHAPISPRTRRRLTYLVTLVEPTALYLLYTLALAYEPYHVETHILAVLAAFGVSQVIHGERALPNGDEMRAMQPVGGDITQPLMGTVYVAPQASVIRVNGQGSDSSNITEGV